MIPESISSSVVSPNPASGGHHICQRCVMDDSDIDIQFDENGVCNHCRSYDNFVQSFRLSEKLKNKDLEKTFARIKDKGRTGEYDCIMGMSGGVDSSYVAFLAKKFGLRPLCVHLDNGWNSEIAVKNIHQIVNQCGFDLYTHVLDWEEFKDLQVSFFKAGVIDLELLTDHAIFGVILQLAKKHKIRTILSGANFSTEHIMPSTWVHRKSDLKNILDIHQKFGSRKLKTFPQVSTIQHVYGMYVLGYQVIKPLNLMEFNKADAKATLIQEFGWKDYGGKHYESLFTKFYQAHILPKKFNVDKRKAHLSTLICSGQISREEALRELAKPLYPADQLENDFEYVCKKLGLGKEWMLNYLHSPGVPHAKYSSDARVFKILKRIQILIGK